MSMTKFAAAARRLVARLSGNRAVRDRLDRVTQPTEHSKAGWEQVQRRTRGSDDGPEQ